MSGLSQYQKFKLATWEYLKTRAYKPSGQYNFFYVGKEFQTVVNIQAARFNPVTYGFYNISYARLDKEMPTAEDCCFYRLRHDYFDEKHFLGIGSNDRCVYPSTLYFDTDKKITAAIKILRIIEPIFTVGTKDELISTYPEAMFLDHKFRKEVIEKLTTSEKNPLQVP